MAAMFARNFSSLERYVIPFRAYDGKEILSGGTDIPQKEVWKSRISEGEIPKHLQQVLVANPIVQDFELS